MSNQEFRYIVEILLVLVLFFLLGVICGSVMVSVI